jgi:hypothetical protein
MRRSFVLSIVLVLLLLVLVFPAPYTTRTVKAASAPADLCTPCLIAVDRRQDLCLASGGSAQFCGDQFNRGIVFCFRYFCEG